MNFGEKITGSDMTKELKTFESRAKKLLADYQAAWEKINANLWPRSDFTGRNLMPILDDVLGPLEEKAADGQGVQEVLGDDIKGFCSALVDEEEAKSFRDKWRVSKRSRKIIRLFIMRLKNISLRSVLLS
ncbi:DUF1048 domain-containing protein [Anaerosolibacter sp.]|uniref:DUF1048 domain-containing protein n=1 Tax=Anaerosolibacter sp. TaxID=1872527 RepID=UPI0039EE31D8